MSFRTKRWERKTKRNAFKTHLSDLSARGAVKAATERGQGPQHVVFVAAFDGVEGLNAGHHVQPLLVLAAELAEVDDEKRVVSRARLNHLEEQGREEERR
jgi:predicted ArsR family transcriptional regulator